MQHKAWAMTLILLCCAQQTVARPATNATADAERGLLGASYGTFGEMVPSGLYIKSKEHIDLQVKTHEFMYGINFALGHLAIQDGEGTLDRENNFHNPSLIRTACVIYHPVMTTTNTQLAAALYLVALERMRYSSFQTAIKFDLMYHNDILGHGYVGRSNPGSIAARATANGTHSPSNSSSGIAKDLLGMVPIRPESLSALVSLANDERTLTFDYKNNGEKLSPYPIYVLLAEYFLGLSRLSKQRSIDNTFKVELLSTYILGTVVSIAQGVRPAAILLPEDAVYAAAYMTGLLYDSRFFKECSVTIYKPMGSGLAQAGVLSLRRP